MTALIPREIRHFHLFCGLGAGARGFNRGQARVGRLQAVFRCIGGIDVDPAAVRDFERLAGTPGTVLDLFSRVQYAAFHGHEPPPGWQEAAPDAIRRAAGGERPHIVFLSAPCKGFSGLMSEARSRTERYVALNALTERGVWLMLEAWADDPAEFVLFENVPRIATRGRALLDRIGALLRHYGYAAAETTHDCGELGNLAQSRKRFLLVARHQARVAPFLYQPPKRALRGVGEVLGRMPLPGDPAAGPMHRVPALQWRTWVRLAFVEAGADWRSLNKLRVADGMLQDFAIAPGTAWHDNALGVTPWDTASGTVTAGGLPTQGRFSVADPRYQAGGEYGQFGIGRWDEPASTVRHVKSPIQGRFSVADPRHAGPPKHCNEFRIVPWAGASGAVTSAHGSGQCVQDPRPAAADWHRGVLGVRNWDEPGGTVAGRSTPGNGAFSVADPRPTTSYDGHGKYAVTAMDVPAGTVIAASTTGNGAFAVADPRQGDWQRGSKRNREPGDAWAGAGHYGVVPWEAPAGAVSASAGHDNGRWSVADPRPELPGPADRLVARIRALDGTWHRPFTTLELAALQSIVDPEEQIELDGLSDAAWRERIGNAVPPAAAAAIAGVMGTTLLLAWSGAGFALSNVPIWVRPVAAALSVQPGDIP